MSSGKRWKLVAMDDEQANVSSTLYAGLRKRGVEEDLGGDEKQSKWNDDGGLLSQVGVDKNGRLLEEAEHKGNDNEISTGKIVVDSVSRSGGLCMFWSGNLDVVLLSYSQGHIDLRVQAHQRKGISMRCWMRQKKMRIPRDWTSISNFRETVDDCGLDDLGFTGPMFTWCNRRNRDDMIQKRLDHFFSTKQWKMLITQFIVRHLNFWQSDHKPILMEIAQELNGWRRNQEGDGRCFYFEECWIDKQECQELVSRGWGETSNGGAVENVLEKIKSYTTHLDRWNKMSRRRLKEEIYSIKKELNSMSRYIVLGVWMKIQDLESLDSYIDREERYWRQHSRIEWLWSGDKNTKCFLMKASGRRARNMVRGLVDENEGLSCFINRGLWNGSITGFKSSRFGHVTSHMFFVGDSLLFTRASTFDCAAIKEILSIYMRVVGQLVNFDNTSMCVSPSVVRQERERLACILGVRIVEAMREDDVTKNLSLHTSLNEIEDSILWHFDQHGNYSVRSGYWVRKAMEELPNSSSNWQVMERLGSNFVSNFLDFMIACMGLLNGDLMCLLCIVLWRNWKHRNAVVHGGIACCVADIMVWSTTYLSEFRSSGLKGRHLHGNQNPKLVVWKPPPSDFYKINTDVAIDVAGQMIGIGIVIRDVTGFVMASSSQRIIATFTPQVAEAMVI
ncbi:hypothetical protein Ddye_009510 [Dipteronia dyeriana]|uniref:Uncharacterized protein n=1 Tax=Dipteronia dyeriana TaxID=168575 RepID=A0AAE0CMY3_9ROSI|nr:hypothetical protein Ddye_009510 [Dipteronia dyeriana]